VSGPGTGVGHQALLTEVRTALSASSLGEEGLRVGLEVEVIPVRDDGGRLPLTRAVAGTAVDDPSASALELVREAASSRDWREQRVPDGLPTFDLPGPASLTFEPGGQIEIRTVPAASVGQATRGALEPLRMLHEVAGRHGVRLLARGMDPEGKVADVPLGTDTPRYRRQAAHYDRVGPWGRRMMLQSAAIHVNLDLGGRPVRRWSVANRMAPYLVALFANSPRYQGQDAGVRSVRAEQWRHLDPSRTGVFQDEQDPAGEYLRFALAARDFLGAGEGAEARSFRAGWEQGADLEAWRAHLTTLFPEVRPRGYLEVRSIDTLRPAWLGVPAVVLAGILYDPRSLEEALRLLPPATEERLLRAGRMGLADEELALTGLQLFDLAVEGAARLGGRQDGEILERARAFRDRFPARRQDPGHESDPTDPFEP